MLVVIESKCSCQTRQILSI